MSFFGFWEFQSRVKCSTVVFSVMWPRSLPLFHFHLHGVQHIYLIILNSLLKSHFHLHIVTCWSDNFELLVNLQLFVNNMDRAKKPAFDTMQYGRDNAVARHGNHGLYKLWTIDVDPKLLQVGQNVFYLTQRKATGPFIAIMYDYLRLEAPASGSTSGYASSWLVKR